MTTATSLRQGQQISPDQTTSNTYQLRKGVSKQITNASDVLWCDTMNGWICDDQNLNMDSEVDHKPVQWGSDMNDVILWIGLSMGELTSHPGMMKQKHAWPSVIQTEIRQMSFAIFPRWKRQAWNKHLTRLYMLIAWSKMTQRFLQLEHKIEFDCTGTDVQAFDGGRWGPSCVAVCVRECVAVPFKVVISINSRCAQVDEVIHD